MRNKNILNLEKRRDIYNFILRFPGSHLSNISKNLNIRKNNVNYHLNILKKHGLIDSRFSDGYLQFYPVKLDGKDAEKIADLFDKSFPYETKNRILSLFKYYIPGRNEKKILAITNRPIPRDILGILFPDFDYSLMEISKALKKHWTTISYHLKKMEKLDIIEKVVDGNEVRYKIKDYLYMLRISFMYNSWHQQVDSKGELEYVLLGGVYDAVYDAFNKIFPAPFCA